MPRIQVHPDPRSCTSCFRMISNTIQYRIHTHILYMLYNIDQTSGTKPLEGELKRRGRNCLGFQVIGMEACSGGGCSWGCKNILGCPGVLEIVGCDRMAPPLNKCDSSESLTEDLKNS